MYFVPLRPAPVTSRRFRGLARTSAATGSFSAGVAAKVDRLRRLRSRLVPEIASIGVAPRPVFIFGISGASWSVLDPLLASGRLPALGRLVREGRRFTLLSTRARGDRHYRPQVAWPTLATGVLPERHGLTRYYHTAQELQAPPFWSVYSSLGLRVGLFEWPMTWPPPELDGFVIPCHHARDARTTPPSLAWIKELEQEQRSSERGERGRRPPLRAAARLARLGVGPLRQARLAATFLRVRRSRDFERRALEMRRAKLAFGADVFLALYRSARPHLGAFVTFHVDFASHRYWRHAADAEGEWARPDLRGAVTSAYVECDRVLRSLLRAVPRDALVAVVSEHGMEPEPVSAEVGDWRYVLRPRRVAELAGLDPALTICPIARWLAVRTSDGSPVPADTAARLRAVTVAETGLPLFHVAEHGDDEVVVKLALDRSVVRHSDGGLEALGVSSVAGTVPFGELASRFGRPRSAMHAREGVLVLAGGAVDPGGAPLEAELVDFAPTILAAAGITPPDGLDGRVLPILAPRVREPGRC